MRQIRRGGTELSDSCEITGRTNGLPATLDDYNALFQSCNRPHKFTAEEVGFTFLESYLITDRAKAPVCGGCRHWFVNHASNRVVCEIMRLPDESNVPSSGTCRFQNVNGEFPLLRVL